MVHDAAADGYRAQADVYAAVRPSYHSDLIGRFVASYGADDVVELGAGTGIFTRQLVEAGRSPVAIEPVAAMRAQLTGSCPHVTVIGATAEATGLANACADTVVVAQAFHWFDHERAIAEIARILRPNGHLVCVWNVRDTEVEWVRTYTDIVDRHAGATPRHRTMHWRRAIEADVRFSLVEDWAVANPREASPQQVADRALSTSFIAALDPETQSEVLGQILALTEPLGSSFEYPYRSELQAWRLGSNESG